MTNGMKTVIEHIAKDTVSKMAESEDTTSSKEKIDSLINRLSQGMTIILAIQKPKENLIAMGNEILKGIISQAADENDDELFVYTIEQLLIKVPSRAKEVLEIVSEKYPKHKEFVDKLIILV